MRRVIFEVVEVMRGLLRPRVAHRIDGVDGSARPSR
jgi:hypothetical protein